MTVAGTLDEAARYALLTRANTLREAGRFGEAEALCRSWLERASGDAEALYLHGLIARDSGRLAEALTRIDAAISLEADAAAWHATRALVLRDLGRTEDALAAADMAISRDPALEEAHATRATLLMGMRRPADALVSLDRLIALRPDHVAAVLHAVAQLLCLARPRAALARIDAELAVRPNDARGHVARAQVSRALNRVDEALESCDRAIELQDDHAHAWFMKGLLLLASGRYAEGWPLYEWRWLTPDFADRQPRFPQPLWDGSPLGGRSLLVHAEQGVGDTIQLFRFLAVPRRDARVVLCVPPPLARLLAAQPDAPTVIAYDGVLPPTDLYCMMGSLPWLLGVELANLPTAPYLRVESAGAEPWPQPAVGIVWAGNPAHHNDANRSMPLRTMLEMLVPGVTIVSLQRDVPDADRDTLASAGHVVDRGRHLRDFMDTAVAMRDIDVIISVDTAPAHLAGALGRPVWVLLPFAADWRWMLDREDSPWYPSARLFRQDRPGDWSGVAARVRQALTAMVAPP